MNVTAEIPLSGRCIPRKAGWWRLGVRLVVSFGLSMCAPVCPASPPDAPVGSSSGYIVKGFRSAQFGDDEAAVRAAIKRDFNLSGTAIVEASEPFGQSRVLSIELPSLQPGPGVARITYFLGQNSQRLAQVSVRWRSDPVTRGSQAQLAAAALSLMRHLRELKWGAGTRELQRINGVDDRVVLFAGMDELGGGISVLSSPSLIELTSSTASATHPPAREPAVLIIHYVSNFLRPDIYRIQPGEF